MQDPRDVICTAAKGFTEEIARRREITERRMWEILAKDNPYPKAKRLIRDIEAVNHAGYELIKADMLALFVELDGGERASVTNAEMSRELHDPVQASLDEKPKAEQLQQCREGIAVLAAKMRELLDEGKPEVRVEMAAAIENRRNGTK